MNTLYLILLEVVQLIVHSYFKWAFGDWLPAKGMSIGLNLFSFRVPNQPNCIKEDNSLKWGHVARSLFLSARCSSCGALSGLLLPHLRHILHNSSLPRITSSSLHPSSTTVRTWDDVQRVTVSPCTEQFGTSGMRQCDMKVNGRGRFVCNNLLLCHLLALCTTTVWCVVCLFPMKMLFQVFFLFSMKLLTDQESIFLLLFF